MSGYGPIDVARWTKLRDAGVHLRVFVRGEDVTARCRFVDDTPGRERAELFRVDRFGRKFIDEDREPAIEVVDADIELRRIP